MTTKVGRIWRFWCLLLVILTISIISVKSDCSTRYCDCKNTNKNTYEYHCGNSSAERSVNVIIKRNDDSVSITISCLNNKDPDYGKWITDLKNPFKEEIADFTIDRCLFSDRPLFEIIDVFINGQIIKKFVFEKGKVEDNSQKVDIGPDQLANLHSIEKIDLSGNSIDELPEQFFANTTNLKHLDLSSNALRSLPAKIFESLKTLEILDLGGNELQNLSKSHFSSLTELKDLRLSNNKLTTINDGVFYNLKNLDRLELTKNKLNRVPETLFDNESKVKFINLNSAFDKRRNIVLPSGFFKNLKSLEDLQLGGNNLTSLPKDIFQFDSNDNAKNSLNNVYLSYNRLSELDDGLFHGLRELKKLRISDNQLTSVTEKLFDGLEKLELLDLCNNQLTMNATDKTSPLRKRTNLKKIFLAHNLLTKVYDDWRHSFNNVEVLQLADNKLEHLTPEDFYFPIPGEPEIHYNNNNISSINLTGVKDFNINLKKFYISNNPIICDCNALSLVEYLKDPNPKFPIKDADNLKCNGPESLKNKPVKEVDLMELKCPLRKTNLKDKYTCPEKCQCNYRIQDEVVEVDCTSRGMESFPKEIPDTGHDTELLFDGNNLTSIEGLRDLSENVRKIIVQLIMPNNKLSKVDGIETLKRLKVLKLDHNRLERLDKDVIDYFTTLKNLTRISLHENRWKCDCDNGKPLISFIRDYHTILNSSEIRCSDNRKVASLTEDDLCNISLVLKWITAITVVVALCLLVLVLYKIYAYEIKVWMFAHKVFRWLVSENDIDRDKEYDAFVSFSHEDQEFVDKYLIPRLEKNNGENYKLCIHYREFIPGEFIPAQITNFVQSSRRTIIVLTPEYLKSKWSLLEFRAAHLQGEQDKCRRVIVVMYRDVKKDISEDHEINAYIKMNTYLEWEDRMFWDKLKYALGRPTAHQRTVQNYARRKWQDNGDQWVRIELMPANVNGR